MFRHEICQVKSKTSRKRQLWVSKISLLTLAEPEVKTWKWRCHKTSSLKLACPDECGENLSNIGGECFFHIFWHWFEPSFLDITHMTGESSVSLCDGKNAFWHDCYKRPCGSATESEPRQLKPVPDSSINSTEEGPKNSEHFRRMGADVYLFEDQCLSTCSYYRFFSVCRYVQYEYGSMILTKMLTYQNSVVLDAVLRF